MRFLFVLLLATALSVVGCGESKSEPSSAASESMPTVVVTSQPLLEMAKSIGKDYFQIRKITPADVSSRIWRPSRSAIQILQKADIILLNGAGYEPWTARVSLPGSRVKDTAAGYNDRLVQIPDAVTHQHGPDGKHAHPGTVWATWLDPELATAQLSQVTSELVRLAPEHKTSIETESAKLKQQLDGLDQDLKAITAKSQSNQTVYCDGPYYQYLAGRLNWNVQYVHWDDSLDLSDADREELTTLLKEKPAEPAAIFLLSSRQSKAAADFATSCGLKVVRIDLCESPSSPASSLVERLSTNINHLRSAIAAP